MNAQRDDAPVEWHSFEGHRFSFDKRSDASRFIIVRDVKYTDLLDQERTRPELVAKGLISDDYRGVGCEFEDAPIARGKCSRCGTNHERGHILWDDGLPSGALLYVAFEMLRCWNIMRRRLPRGA